MQPSILRIFGFAAWFGFIAYEMPHHDASEVLIFIIALWASHIGYASTHLDELKKLKSEYRQTRLKLARCSRDLMALTGPLLHARHELSKPSPDQSRILAEVDLALNAVLDADTTGCCVDDLPLPTPNSDDNP